MTEKLKKILSEIESGKRKNIYNLKLTKEELLSQDNNGITFLEHLLRKDISLFLMKEVIKNDIEVAKIFCECDKSLYMFEFDENTLFSVIDGQMFIEYLLEKDKFIYVFMSNIKERLEIIDMLVSYKKEYLLKNLTKELIEKLITKNNEGDYLIEKYLENDSVLKNIIPLINDINVLMELCIKNNNYKLLRYVNENILMSNYNGNNVLEYLINEIKIVPEKLEHIPQNTEYIKFLLQNNYQKYLQDTIDSIQITEIENGKTLLEILIEQGYDPDFYMVWEEKTISILHKINRLDLITNTIESFLIKPAREILNDDSITDNITLLEYMLDNNYNPLFKTFNITNDNIIKILYQKQRPDLLAKAEIEKILNETENNKTYFDYILESIKYNGLKIDVNKIIFSADKLETIVKIYLIIANHDMMEYVNELKEEELLKKYGETTLLEALLQKDSNLTLNKILKDSVKSKPNIAAILKSKGLVQQQVDVVLKKEDFTSEYFQQEQSKLGIGPLMEEGEYLLNKLENLFLSDGKSDKNLITALITGYRQALFTNYEVNINEIKKLIQIKEENLDRFFYLKEENGAYFKPSNGSVFSDTIAVETLLHETGHALHYYLAKNEIIENYQEITKRVRKNPETLKKVEDYANRYNFLCEETKKLVEQKYKEFFSSYYTEARKEKIKKLLSKSKEEKKEEFRNLGIPEEQLDIILEGMFSEEEFIAHQKRIFIRENVDAIMRSEFGSLMAIGDILDAIYEGKLNSEHLKNKQGEKIKRTPGHGLRYYYGTKHGFDEMIANFSYISKSNESQEMLELLKSIIGDELYNMLSEFYYQNIVGIKEEEQEASKSMGGK